MPAVTTPVVPERIAWAVEQLDLRPGDHVLEIGGGNGVAASLVCERLTSGRLVMIDRSATATARAVRRNADHVASGRLEVVTTDLASLDVPAGSFDAAFCVDVNVFWTTSAAPELAVLARALRPRGSIAVLYGAAGPTGPDRVIEAVSAAMRAAGFAPRALIGDRGFGVVGRPAIS